MGKLSDKQKMFVKEYLIDLNATQAAIRSGYSKKTANKIGSQNLAKLDIQEAIQKAMDDRAGRTEITADRVLQEIAKLGFANMMDYMTVQENGLAVVDLSLLTRDQAAAITELTVETRKEFKGENENDSATIEKVKFKLADKGQNLERLGRHLKLFTDKTEVDISPLTVVLAGHDVGTL
jgi:phage terminase small subunit